MRFALAFVCILATACGSNSKGNGSDAAPGDGTHGGGDTGGNGDGQSGGGATIHVTLTNHPTNAAMFTFLVAYQDGSGTWQLASAPSGDTYSFKVNAPSWGVMWTCIGTSPSSPTALRQVTEAHFAVAERTSLTMTVPPRCTDSGPASVALTGTVSNRSGGGGWGVLFGNKAGLVNPQTGAYRVEATPGTADLVLVHAVSTGNTTGNGADFTATEALVQRGVTITTATTHDFDASEVVATRSFTVTVPLSNQSDRAVATTQLYSAGGTSGTLDRVTQSFESDALATIQGVNGDVYDQQITVTGNGQTAIVTNATSTPADQTYAAPSPLGGATSQVTGTTPYPIVQTTWAAYANTIGYAWQAFQVPSAQQCGGGACAVLWTVLLSPGVSGGSPGYTTPDFSGLAGWDNSLAFVSGAMITGYAEAATSSGGASDFPPVTPPPAGTQRTYVRSAFTVTP